MFHLLNEHGSSNIFICLFAGINSPFGKSVTKHAISYIWIVPRLVGIT
jgi:hypothetical protein